MSNKTQYWFLEKAHKDGTGQYFKVAPANCDKCKQELLGRGCLRIEWNRKREASMKHYHQECYAVTNHQSADITEDWVIMVVGEQAYIPKAAIAHFPKPPEIQVATHRSGEVVSTFQTADEAIKKDQASYKTKSGQCLAYLEEKGLIAKEETKELSYEEQQDKLHERMLELEQRPHEMIVVKASGWETPEVLKAQSDKKFDDAALKAERGAFFDQVMAERILSAKLVTKNLLENKKQPPSSGDDQ